MTASDVRGVNGDQPAETNKVLLQTALRGGTQTHEVWLPENPTADDVRPIIDALQRLVAGDLVHHPAHYNSHPSGIEAIGFCEHLGFNVGNAAKYIYRYPFKGSALLDIRKSRWYIERELRREAEDLPDDILRKLAVYADSDIGARVVLLLIERDLEEAKRVAADAERSLLTR